MKVTIQDTNLAPITVNAAPGNDAEGNPGSFAAPLQYSVSDATIATITPAADGSSVTVTPLGKEGDATITATDGVISASFDIEVVGGEATSIIFTQEPAAPAPAQAAAS